MNDQVTAYISNTEKWTQELTLLRSFLLELELEETIKWGIPAYVYKGKNIMGMSAFKNYLGLWFHQGVFINDECNVLMNAQEGKTKAMRQWRFYSIEELDKVKIKNYALQAMKNVELGKEIKPTRNKKPLEIPQLLQDQFDANEELKSKFESFSLSKQREFTEYITSAKREATKISRLEKITPMILNNIGLNDKYRK
ncbi:YdeI/OmpD-associated family protein [uncultured Tenacibaculum sp.]|uniref:YdeI/OmpD-associated family protein n=1 Tax=uncultured Tenacibaculum sp. TaxID=174713 RepID=UPI00261EB0B9|nr:YdeI/OmpD-associated family protein [uncultured Tenacibaculum sp.]